MKNSEVVVEDERISKIINFHMPRWEELPTIDLYMDQIITYVQDAFSDFVQEGDADKVITKSMINNYVKLKVINPPNNKKYNREHLAHIMAISILKIVFSISEISYFIKLQEKEYSVDNAYNYLCLEFENALCYTFSKRDEIVPNSASKITKETEIFRSMILSVTNKIYVELFMMDGKKDDIAVNEKKDKKEKDKKDKKDKKNKKSKKQKNKDREIQI